MFSAAHVDILCNVAHDINYLLLLIKLQTLLREIAETHGITDIETALVWLYQSEQHLQECGFARTVAAHYTHFLKAGEVIVEVFHNDHIVILLRDILTLEDLAADIDIAGLQTDLSLLNTLFGDAFQIIKSLFTIAGLMSSGLWHPSHPFQFRAIKVVGTSDLGPFIIDALLPLFQIITVVAPIGIDSLIIEFKDDRAYTIQEETVVGHHQEGLIPPPQIALQPLNHLQIEMICRLV